MSDSHLDFRHYQGRRVLLGVTGSIAAVRAVELLRRLTASGCGVGATLTAAAQEFIRPLAFASLGAEPVYAGMFDASHSPFSHLEPAQAAEVLVIAPATANCLAKLACGLADDLLSTQALAFTGPVVVAPAMNPRLWQAQATQANWRLLLERGVVGVEPECGAMACGESGQGRLADVRTIALAVLKALSPQDMAGRRVLLTAGPTHEPWDPVRYWANPSTGRMGAALAVAAWLRGAAVTVVLGPCDPWLPPGIEVVRVATAQDMDTACQERWEGTDIGCLTAAVADFAPVPHGAEKFKKSALAQPEFAIRFRTNPDILRRLGQRKTANQMLVGFAAETGELESQARAKLAAKNLDLIVANPVNEPGAGFGSATNRVVVVDRQGRVESWPVLAKTEVAWRIWDHCVSL